jgi:hypothetical protein
MDVVVRRATPVDVPGLARLRWRWRIEDRGEHTDLDRESFVDLFTTWVLDHAATHLPFVAEVDGRLVGMAWLLPYHRCRPLGHWTATPATSSLSMSCPSCARTESERS